MSKLSLVHDLFGSFGPVWAYLILLVQMVLDTVRPTLDLLIPGVIGILAHRWIKNQTVADLVTQGAGIAYNHLGAKLQAGGMSFADAKAAAIGAAQEALRETAARQLAHVTPDAVADGIDGALGKLLAVDPNFSLSKGATAPARNPVVVENKVVLDAGAQSALDAIRVARAMSPVVAANLGLTNGA